MCSMHILTQTRVDRTNNVPAGVATASRAVSLYSEAIICFSLAGLPNGHRRSCFLWEDGDYSQQPFWIPPSSLYREEWTSG